MEQFIQAVAIVLIGVILWLFLSGHGKEYALLLSLGVCCLVSVVAIRFLQPVMELVVQLQDIGNLDSEWVSVLLKTVGIGLITELAALLCTDAGNASMGKTVQILGSATVLWLSVPLMNSLLALISQILGEI